MCKDGNIQGGVRMQNQNYLVTENPNNSHNCHDGMELSWNSVNQLKEHIMTLDTSGPFY